MNYKIIENPTYTMRSKIGIEIFPINEPLMFFLSGLKKERFPYYISQLLENSSFGVENAWFTFYHEMDGGFLLDFKTEFGREMSDDEIEVRFYDGKPNYSVIKVKDFENIFYDYSKKLYEIYQSDVSLPEKWNEEMQEALEKLKIKIDNKRPLN